MDSYRRELHEFDPELPILQMVTFPAFMEKNFTLRMIELGATIFGIFGATLPLAMVVALTALELLVAFLQAYVFAILTCIYLNDAIHPGH